MTDKGARCLEISEIMVRPLPKRFRSVSIAKAIAGNVLILIGQDGQLYHTRKYTYFAGHLSVSTLRALEREKILERGSVDRHIKQRNEADARITMNRDRAEFNRIAKKYRIRLTGTQRKCFKG